VRSAHESSSRVKAPACRCCGSINVTHRGRKRGEFIQKEFDFFNCRECELLFVDPVTSVEIYNDDYYRGQGADPLVDYESEYRDWRGTSRRLEFDDLARLADEFFFEHPPFGPIEWLDFGCGAGGFLKYLRERGAFRGQPLSVTGHDVGPYADLLRRKDGFRILDFEGLDGEPNDRYDVITMVEVIEHIPHPDTAMRTIARILKPGGLLVLTTGNLDCRAARRQGIDYRYCVPEIHVNLYNPRCLARLYFRHGLRPYAVQYHDAIKFKIVKSLRHRRALRAMASLAVKFPPVVWYADKLYGVSAMPCAIKSERR
jgi:SAM-dependent methyltransferase